MLLSAKLVNGSTNSVIFFMFFKAYGRFEKKYVDKIKLHVANFIFTINFWQNEVYPDS